jgi:hypothetical protein
MKRYLIATTEEFDKYFPGWKRFTNNDIRELAGGKLLIEANLSDADVIVLKNDSPVQALTHEECIEWLYKNELQESGTELEKVHTQITRKSHDE